MFSNIHYFLNLFLKTPTFHGRLDGRSCSCMLYSENLFKLVHEWVVGNMRYTLDNIVVSIGIIGFFQLVSILTFIVYSYIFLCMYAYSSNSINFDWYLNFHTYICFYLCSKISQILFMLKLEF